MLMLQLYPIIVEYPLTLECNENQKNYIDNKKYLKKIYIVIKYK